jgi:hypothetical protein
VAENVTATARVAAKMGSQNTGSLTVNAFTKSLPRVSPSPSRSTALLDYYDVVEVVFSE